MLTCVRNPLGQCGVRAILFITLTEGSGLARFYETEQNKAGGLVTLIAGVIISRKAIGASKNTEPDIDGLGTGSFIRHEEA